MELERARNQIRLRCSQMRAVLRIAETKEFERAFKLAAPEQLKELILISQTRELRIWMARVCGRYLEVLSYRRLREMAKMENVHNYSRLTRDELIAALEKRHNVGKLETSPNVD